MTTIANLPQVRRRYAEALLDGLASPYSMLDIFLDLHLGESAIEADALALQDDWLVVGRCLREALDDASQFAAATRGLGDEQ